MRDTRIAAAPYVLAILIAVSVILWMAHEAGLLRQ